MEAAVAAVHQGARRRLRQKLKGKTVMKRDNASKQREPDERMMIDDGQRETAPYERCAAALSERANVSCTPAC